MDLPKLNPIRFDPPKVAKKSSLWPDQTDEKAKRVKAEGDYRVDSSALSKKYREVLMGRGPEDGVERREVEVDESENSDQASNLNESQIQQSNETREKLMQKAKVVAKSAMKMDGDADLDPEGYRNVRTEAQAFRVDQQSMERVKIPLTVSHNARQNHGVLKRSSALTLAAPRSLTNPAILVPTKEEESKRANAPSLPEVANFAKNARGKDAIHETISKRDDLTLEIGKLFLRIVGTDFDLVAAVQSNPSLDESRKNGQVLILKEIQKMREPSPEETNDLKSKFVEASTREEVKILATHLGKVFVDIGMTLPSGHSIEDARRNDAIALSIGSKAINNIGSVGGLLSTSFTSIDSQKAQKTELIATAIGRILMHLRGASQAMSARMESPSVEQTPLSEDRTILALGRLTLQMIEQSAGAGVNKVAFEPRKQGESFIRKLGLAVFKGASAIGGLGGLMKPSIEDARRAVMKAKEHSMIATELADNAKSESSLMMMEDARKQDSLQTKTKGKITAAVQPNRPILLRAKQPVEESSPMKLNMGAPSIDTLPTHTHATHLQGRKSLRPDLPERTNLNNEQRERNGQRERLPDIPIPNKEREEPEPQASVWKQKTYRRQ
jgi:hypothetical protein